MGPRCCNTRFHTKTGNRLCDDKVYREINVSKGCMWSSSNCPLQLHSHLPPGQQTPGRTLGLLVSRALRRQHNSQRCGCASLLRVIPRAFTCAGTRMCQSLGSEQKPANSYSSYSSLQKAKPLGPRSTFLPRDSHLNSSPRCMGEKPRVAERLDHT